MSRKSYLDCPHNNVQDWTDFCLDCFCNINMTPKEYKKQLKEKLEQSGKQEYLDIRALEKKLSIK